MQIRFCQSLINSGLIRAEGAAALQDQRIRSNGGRLATTWVFRCDGDWSNIANLPVLARSVTIRTVGKCQVQVAGKVKFWQGLGSPLFKAARL